MSSGELSGSKNPWAELELDPTTLMGAVAREALAVEFASGDVKAANERLIDEVSAAQRAVALKRQGLARSQQELREHLNGISLEGRPIDFDSGQTLGAADYSDGEEKPQADLKTVGEDLAGSTGVIVGFEVGAHLGKPLDSPEAVVFLVEMDESSEMLCAGVEGYRYGVIANRADYTIGELPQPEE